MKKITTKIATAATISTTIITMAASSGTPVLAKSATRTESNSKLNATITSNAWIQSIASNDGTGLFQVSAVYKSKDKRYTKPQWVKTAWDFYALGIAPSVSYKGVGASVSGSGYTTTSKGTWKNSNGANISWYKGRVGATGFTFYVGLYNTASAFKAGQSLSTLVKI